MVAGRLDRHGCDDGRFRGDSSLYGNAELRWWIGKQEDVSDTARRYLDAGDGQLLMVTSDRISAFDVVMSERNRVDVPMVALHASAHRAWNCCATCPRTLIIWPRIGE